MGYSILALPTRRAYFALCPNRSGQHHPRAGNYLDSCAWQTRQQIDLTSADARGSFTLERGTRLLIWLRDPTGALSRVNAQSLQPVFSLIDAKGVARELLRANQQGDGTLLYSSVVPFSQDYVVVVQSNGLRLLSAKGESLPILANRPVSSRQLLEIIVDDLTLVP